MPRVKFTRHLQRFFPDLNEVEERYPGLTDYLIDEQGALRQHVNVSIGKGLIRDREHLRDCVADDDRLFIFQALSGG
jgi:molybdopterin synthase sulfur carrier subunit